MEIANTKANNPFLTCSPFEFWWSELPVSDVPYQFKFLDIINLRIKKNVQGTCNYFVISTEMLQDYPNLKLYKSHVYDLLVPVNAFTSALKKTPGRKSIEEYKSASAIIHILKYDAKCMKITYIAVYSYNTLIYESDNISLNPTKLSKDLYISDVIKNEKVINNEY
jgi:hypothetical protein